MKNSRLRHLISTSSLIVYPILSSILGIWLVSFLPRFQSQSDGKLVAHQFTYILVASIFIFLVIMQLLCNFGMTKSRTLELTPQKKQWTISQIANWHVFINALGLFSLLIECLIYYNQMPNYFSFQVALMGLIGILYLATGVFDFKQLWQTFDISYFSLFLSLENFIILLGITSFELSVM